LNALANAVELVGMPHSMRAALDDLVQRAEQAETAGRDAEVRTLIQAVITTVKAVSGTLISEHDAARIRAVAQPLRGKA
jgi:hypothetical protein